MRLANAKMVINQESDKQAAEFLLQQCLPARKARANRKSGFSVGVVFKQASEHLRLVAISLSLAVLIGIPLGILASRSPAAARLTLSAVGLLQTIPSLALLAFMIPVTGTGPGPTVVALFVYSILPIVRNTYTGLTTLPGHLSEAANALGMPPPAQLWRIRLPMASPSILAGIKTSSVINVGTAITLLFAFSWCKGLPAIAGRRQIAQGVVVDLDHTIGAVDRRADLIALVHLILDHPFDAARITNNADTTIFDTMAKDKVISVALHGTHHPFGGWIT